MYDYIHTYICLCMLIHSELNESQDKGHVGRMKLIAL